MTLLSVNINKIALIRNARGDDFPNLLQFAQDCEKLGAQGITVHPRPDQRHIRFDDLAPLKNIVQGEFNIEGNPSPDFLALVCQIRPHQCTLVPDAPDALTSNAGWDCIQHQEKLQNIVQTLHQHQIRVSIFVDAQVEQIQAAKATGAEAVELYTGPYAKNFKHNPQQAVQAYVQAAAMAKKLGLRLNAGHDLNLHNLGFFKQQIPDLDEVSIGHALVVDALYLGLPNCLERYLNCLKTS